MIPTKTHTVVSAYLGRDGQARVYVKDHPVALKADEPLTEGTSVVIQGDRAVRASEAGGVW